MIAPNVAYVPGHLVAMFLWPVSFIVFLRVFRRQK
jgi:hypothetical protein